VGLSTNETSRYVDGGVWFQDGQRRDITTNYIAIYESEVRCLVAEAAVKAFPLVIVSNYVA
jgi:hypothetical protein